MNKKYDILIVGAGVAGCVVARELANAGEQVLLIDQRKHIGGNCYDCKDEHGVLIHPYGPHIFHTSKEEVYAYLSQFTKWHSFPHKVVANIFGEFIPVPFNLNSLQAAFGVEGEALKEKLIATYGEDKKVPILELMNHEDPSLQKVGQYVYDNVYVYYTMKQWGKKPEEIDPEVTARVPVNISYEDTYFSDTYQGVPLDGFTAMFEEMIAHEYIDLRLQVKAEEVLTIEEGKIRVNGEEWKGKVVYTGPIDEFLDCKYGRLPYRSLRFAFEHYHRDDYQGYSVVNYTVDQEYTRITEYKRLTGQVCEGTTISKEYPFAYGGNEGEIPYYAIANEENEALYQRYVTEVSNLSNFILLGRLAEYRYYNMDVMVEKALELSRKLIQS